MAGRYKNRPTSSAPVEMMRGLLKTVSVAAAVCVLVLVFAIFVFCKRLIGGLPDVRSLKNFRHELTTEVFSEDGRKIGEFTTERRYPVQFEKIPHHVIQAFLAAEDAKFYEHGGIDIAGVFRAILSNLLKGRYAQGGSTITQQVARSILLTRKKELTRKIREMILAQRMEKELTKNEILGLYLSEIYLGHGAFGIGAAALNYFGKKVEDLDLAEAAMLAGLPQRPNEWDPFHNPHRAKQRQQYVLRRMFDEKFITEAEGTKALNETLKLYTLEELNTKAAPYFTEYVRQYLMSKYGSENILSQGFKVYTTVRYDYQKDAERALSRGLREVDKRLGWRGVKRHLASQSEVDAFSDSVHEDTLENLTRARLLPPNLDPNAKKLLFDLTPFQDPKSKYFGPTPLAEGDTNKAVVLQIEDAKGMATARVGKTPVYLPLSTMDWIKIDNKTIKAISRVLRPGDLVDVKIDRIDRKLNAIYVSLDQEPEIQGALLSYDINTGLVRAMVGGRDFVESKFNRALYAKRQVGSTFKPILYAAAIDKGFSPSSIVTDSPIVFKYDGSLDADNAGEDWRPHNYGGKFEGDIPLRLALIRSMNIPTVKLLNEITIDYGIKYARSVGITAALPRDLSIALGSWSSSLEELMRAYAAFPRLGKPLVLNYIKKVVDSSGKVVEELPAEHVVREATSPPTVPGTPGAPAEEAPDTTISPQTAYVMTDMLKGVVREGTGHAASSVGGSIAGKTGTSNDHRDAWFVGYTPYVMTGVWVGYDKDKPLDSAETGGHAAAPIWAEYMNQVSKDYPRNDFPIPDDIVFAYVDRDTGKLATASTAKRVRVAFKMGTVPNASGSNLPRIGEPGTTRATTTVEPTPSTPTEAAKQEDTTDYIREGYQN
jgi:penicillin-binding protein 1A